MANKVNKLMSRMMLGKEKSEDYARSTLPTNRWELFWDIFKGRFWKLVIINFLTVIFFIPFLIMLFSRHGMIINYGTYYPFAQGFGVGYLAAPSIAGFGENIVFNVNMVSLLGLPITFAIAGIGLAGGLYVIRNMVWTEGVFVANDFWRGIRHNYKNVFKILFSYSIILYIMILSISVSEMSIASNADNSWMYVLAKIFAYMVIGFYTLMCLHMLTMSVTYELKFSQLLKNSFYFTIALLPQSVFFLFLGGLTFWFFLLEINFFLSMAMVLSLMIGVSLFMLVWTNYSQWAYDEFLNDKVPGAKKQRGIYEKIQKGDAKSLQKYKEQVDAAMLTSLRSRPIKPIDDDLKLAELPNSFRRDDILKLNESRQAIIEDHEKYVEEHKNDEQFVQYEQAKLSAEQEREKRIAKAKKELARRKRNK